MPTSANGWPTLDADVGVGPYPRLRKFIVPDSDRHFVLRDGSAGFLLTHLAIYFDRKVEDLGEGIWDDWGYAYRSIRGQSTGYSNHASGTAMDLNATRHGLGSQGTFSADEEARIRARLKGYHGLIRWGGDYHGRKDEMHFEINGPLSACEQLARELMDLAGAGKTILAANPGLRNVILS